MKKPMHCKINWLYFSIINEIHTDMSDATLKE